jgi:ABC-type transport system involved in cytochrome bd biosynthesis fused ATPase/permease subunit
MGFQLRMGEYHACYLLLELNTNLTYSDTEKREVESTYSIESLRNVALKNLSLSIRPGEKVAICGRSGRYITLHLALCHIKLTQRWIVANLP